MIHLDCYEPPRTPRQAPEASIWSRFCKGAWWSVNWWATPGCTPLDMLCHADLCWWCQFARPGKQRMRQMYANVVSCAVVFALVQISMRDNFLHVSTWFSQPPARSKEDHVGPSLPWSGVVDSDGVWINLRSNLSHSRLQQQKTGSVKTFRGRVFSRGFAFVW